MLIDKLTAKCASESMLSKSDTSRDFKDGKLLTVGMKYSIVLLSLNVFLATICLLPISYLKIEILLYLQNSNSCCP